MDITIHYILLIFNKLSFNSWRPQKNTVFWRCGKLTLSRQKKKFHLGVTLFDKNPAKPARYINAPKQIHLK